MSALTALTQLNQIVTFLNVPGANSPKVLKRRKIYQFSKYAISDLQLTVTVTSLKWKGPAYTRFYETVRILPHGKPLTVTK